MPDWKEATECLHFADAGGIPNHPKLPALVCRRALEPAGRLADRFESAYAANGWRGSWRWGVFGFHHFHSNAHEALGVASGTATLELGGPGGTVVEVGAGDLILLPAGTGHRNAGGSRDFQVVGAYPAGQEDYDLIRIDGAIDPRIRARIRGTPLPDRDPLFGEDGPVLRYWR